MNALLSALLRGRGRREDDEPQPVRDLLCSGRSPPEMISTQNPNRDAVVQEELRRERQALEVRKVMHSLGSVSTTMHNLVCFGSRLVQESDLRHVTARHSGCNTKGGVPNVAHCLRYGSVLYCDMRDVSISSFFLFSCFHAGLGKEKANHPSR